LFGQPIIDAYTNILFISIYQYIDTERERERGTSLAEIKEQVLYACCTLQSKSTTHCTTSDERDTKGYEPRDGDGKSAPIYCAASAWWGHSIANFSLLSCTPVLERNILPNTYTSKNTERRVDSHMHAITSLVHTTGKI
tara:strand:- start:155 stop:571 length:417 start_codon:yes stop_codon:yes gene_type:complete